jgi:hypothetical protein
MLKVPQLKSCVYAHEILKREVGESVMGVKRGIGNKTRGGQGRRGARAGKELDRAKYAV